MAAGPSQSNTLNLSSELTSLVDSVEHQYWRKAVYLLNLVILPLIQQSCDILLKSCCESILKPLFGNQPAVDNHLAQLHLGYSKFQEFINSTFPKAFLNSHRLIIPPLVGVELDQAQKSNQYSPYQIDPKYDSFLIFLDRLGQAVINDRRPRAQFELQQIARYRDLISDPLSPWTQRFERKLLLSYSNPKYFRLNQNILAHTNVEHFYFHHWEVGKVFVTRYVDPALLSCREASDFDMTNLDKIISSCPWFRHPNARFLRGISDQFREDRNSLFHNTDLSITEKQYHHWRSAVLKFIPYFDVYLPHLIEGALRQVAAIHEMKEIRTDVFQVEQEKLLTFLAQANNARAQAIFDTVHSRQPKEGETMEAVIVKIFQEFLTPQYFLQMQASIREALYPEEIRFLIRRNLGSVDSITSVVSSLSKVSEFCYWLDQNFLQVINASFADLWCHGFLFVGAEDDLLLVEDLIPPPEKETWVLRAGNAFFLPQPELGLTIFTTDQSTGEMSYESMNLTREYCQQNYSAAKVQWNDTELLTKFGLNTINQEEENEEMNANQISYVLRSLVQKYLVRYGQGPQAKSKR